MKGIFSAATLVAVFAALTSAAPTLNERSPNGPVIATIGAEFIRVTSESQPSIDLSSVYGTQQGVISRNNGQDEHASYVSFNIPDISLIPGASAQSTCHLVIKNPAYATGSQNTQLFSLGGGLFTATSPLTFWSHPYHNQYLGVYTVNIGGDSTPIDVASIPCQFGTEAQYVLRPQNDNDYINWNQNNAALVGAFIEVRN